MEPYTSDNHKNETPGAGYPYEGLGQDRPASGEPPMNAAQAADTQSANPAQAAPDTTPGTPPAAGTGNYWDAWQDATQNATQSAAWTNPDAATGAAGTENAQTGAASWDSQNSSYSAGSTSGAASWDSQHNAYSAGGTGWDGYGQQAQQTQQSTGWDGYAQQTQQTQQTQQAAGGWEPYGNGWQNPASHQYVYTPAKSVAQPPKTERKKSKAPRVVAMLLACSLFGFGGGMLGSRLGGAGNTGEPTVIYKAAEGNNTSADPESALSLSDVADKAKASVVAIETENVVQNFNMGGQIISGAGSGVIISEDGTIITNHHVVDGARNVVVRTEDGTEYEAKVLGSDKRSDIAVLKIDAKGLTPAVIGESDGLRVGEYCLAVGNPTGALEGTVTDGIISAVNRSVTIDGNTMTLLQMSAAVSPGNSGGGLFNTKGELIGIVNAKSDGDSVEGLGFAIPVNDAMTVAEELITHGVVTRPGLGVTIMDLTNERDAAQAGVEKPGVYVNSVSEGSAAERAGIRAGDRVVSVEGNPVNSSDDLSSAIAARSVGDKLNLVVERDGREIEITATLGVLDA